MTVCSSRNQLKSLYSTILLSTTCISFFVRLLNLNNIPEVTIHTWVCWSFPRLCLVSILIFAYALLVVTDIFIDHSHPCSKLAFCFQSRRNNVNKTANYDYYFPDISRCLNFAKLQVTDLWTCHLDVLPSKDNKSLIVDIAFSWDKSI